MNGNMNGIVNGNMNGTINPKTSSISPLSNDTQDDSGQNPANANNTPGS